VPPSPASRSAIKIGWPSRRRSDTTSEQREPEAKLFNHAELVYAPGERALAQRFFEALGCGVMETGGPYLVVQLDPKSKNFYDNVL
jgi:hypothetical protein